MSTALLSALEQARLIRERAVSPIEIVEEYLQRIERIDSVLNSYVTVCADEALAQAHDPPPGHFRAYRCRSRISSRPPESARRTRAVPFADHVPNEDSALVRRIRAAGFIVLGKTNTPEFGTTAVTESDLNGICRNPWNPAKTPGGSSGGAAAAVAAGLAPLAQGGDGAGSIRIPASCCGLFGLKPTRGRTSTAPHGNALGLAVYGPLARTVADAAAFLDVISGPEPGDPHLAPPPERPFLEEVGAPPGRLRVALVVDPPTQTRVDPVCIDAAREAGALLEELGHDVEEVTIRWGQEDLRELFTLVWQTIPTLHVSDTSQLEPLNAAFGARALATSSVDYIRAYSQLQRYGRRVAEFCADYDVVLTPTLALPPVPVGWVHDPEDPWEQHARAIEFTPYTAPANVAGLPAVSIPFSWTDVGLPIGVQLIASAAGEPVLLRLSAQIEDARPWANRRPPLDSLAQA